MSLQSRRSADRRARAPRTRALGSRDGLGVGRARTQVGIGWRKGMNLARKGKKEETLGKNKEIEKREMREGMKGKRKEI